MTDAEIEEVLRGKFAPPVRNDATVSFAEDINRFVVRDWSGPAHGYRRSIDEANQLAATLPTPPPERKKHK
jgi:hypothetical protein